MEETMIAKQAHSLLTPQDMAERLGVSVTTLATWRCTKRYPLAYVKVGRLVRYRMGDVEAFEISRLQGVVANDWELETHRVCRNCGSQPSQPVCLPERVGPRSGRTHSGTAVWGGSMNALRDLRPPTAGAADIQHIYRNKTGAPPLIDPSFGLRVRSVQMRSPLWGIWHPPALAAAMPWQRRTFPRWQDAMPSSGRITMN